ncbi:MAG: hypothetical protein F6J92_20260 [Symploca sp. SIO1A3]|nr:hypothetical protein [Symploca sp. SIO1A3]
MFKIHFSSSMAASIALFSIGLSSGQANAANLYNISNPILPSQITTIADNLAVPYEIAVDGSDLVITTFDALVKIDPLGQVTTVAPLTPGSPGGVVAVDGNYIVAEYATGSLLHISQDGNISTIAANLGFPVGVAQQGDSFIVVDIGIPEAENGQIGDARLLRVSLDGTVSVIASEDLGAPIAVAVEGDQFWLTDYGFGRLLSVSETGEVTTVASNLGQALDIELDGQDFIITDFADGFNTSGNGRILRVSRSGEIKTLFSGENPSAITIRGTELLVSDVFAGTISSISGVVNQPLTSVPESSNVLALLVFSGCSIFVWLKRKVKGSTEPNMEKTTEIPTKSDWAVDL